MQNFNFFKSFFTFTESVCRFSMSNRDLHRVPETKKPDPTQTRNRVGFGFENQFFSGSGRFSGFNFLVRVGFGFKNQLFFSEKYLNLLDLYQIFDNIVFVTDRNSNIVCGFKNFKR